MTGGTFGRDVKSLHSKNSIPLGRAIYCVVGDVYNRTRGTLCSGHSIGMCGTLTELVRKASIGGIGISIVLGLISGFFSRTISAEQLHKL
jgi:hypothetical protein